MSDPGGAGTGGTLRGSRFKSVWGRPCIGLLALWIWVPSVSRSELLEAELTIAGMTCAFCAFGIEKKLRGVEGVRDVTVLLDEGQIRLVLSPANAATPRGIQAAVKDAGFKLSQLELQVRGKLMSEANVPTLDAGNATRFRLLEAHDGRIGPLGVETRQAMEAASGGGLLRVRGVLNPESGEMNELIVRSFSQDVRPMP